MYIHCSVTYTLSLFMYVSKARIKHVRKQQTHFVSHAETFSLRIVIYTDLSTFTPNKIYTLLSYFIWYQFLQQAVAAAAVAVAVSTKRSRMPSRLEKCELVKQNSRRIAQINTTSDRGCYCGIACRLRYVCKLMYFHVLFSVLALLTLLRLPLLLLLQLLVVRFYLFFLSFVISNVLNCGGEIKIP